MDSLNIAQDLSEPTLKNIRRSIVGINTKVPLLNGTSCEYIYFDNAASTPPLKEVMEAVNNFAPWYSSVHRGSGFKSKVATEAYEQARNTVLDFFGANNDDHVAIFGKNTTEAINKLSYRLALTQKDVVLVGTTEHHSNDLPWRRTAEVHHIRVDNQGCLIEASLDDLLRKFKGRVKLVAITGGSNVTGYVPDIHELAKRAHAAGAYILVDCAQLAGHRKINIKPLDSDEHLDFVAVSAHKMYAPFGTGALIGRRDVFEQGLPELSGGGTVKFVTEDEVEWADPPERDEAGSPNVIGAVAFARALKFLQKVSLQSIAVHEAKLVSYGLSKLKEIKGIKIYGDTNPDNAASRLGVIAFNLASIPNGLVAAILGAEWGIGVRNGCFCSHPYVASLMGLSPEAVKRLSNSAAENDRSSLPGMVRISFGMYNTKKEVDRLVYALEHIAAGAFEGNYEQNIQIGEFNPVGWQPVLPKFF